MKNISSKELNYISDILSWELLSAKKCYFYSQQEPNAPQTKSITESAAVHAQNYNDLLGYIDQVKKAQGGGSH